MPDRWGRRSAPPRSSAATKFATGVRTGSISPRCFPTQTVFAAEHREDARKLSAAFSTPYYFPGTTDDLLGLGLCAALKNCYAIAFGSLTGNDARPNLRALAFGTALGEICATVTAAGGRPRP